MHQFHNQKAFSSVPKVLTLAAALFVAGNSFANQALAQKNDCLGCHAVAVKLVGPAFKDVAIKYAGQSDAAERLAESIRNGSVGKWGDLSMPAHPKLSVADTKKLVDWILTIK
jgi:cytochrome c